MIYRVLRLDEVTDGQLAQWFREADDDRRARTLRKKDALARKQSICADHLARELLHEFCGCNMIEFQRTERGKLIAPSLPCEFSLSHSGEFVACAVHESAVGIDLETPREVRLPLVERVCNAAERDYIFSGGSLDAARFLEIWTAKEAVLKLRGTGIAADLQSVAVVEGDGLHISGLHLLREATPEYILSVVYK